MALHTFEIARLKRLNYREEDLLRVAVSYTSTHVTVDETDPNWTAIRDPIRASRLGEKQAPIVVKRLTYDPRITASVCADCDKCHGFVKDKDGLLALVKCELLQGCCGGGFIDNSLAHGSCPLRKWDASPRSQDTRNDDSIPPDTSRHPPA